MRFPFEWRAFDQFPHPMFSGGSDEAYRAFADHLAQFYGAGDNFDFLSQHHWFETQLRYVFGSGQVGIDTSFDEVTACLPNRTASPPPRASCSRATRPGFAVRRLPS